MSFRLVSGSDEAQGKRDTMEDTHKTIDNATSLDDYSHLKFSRVAYYGVYDGHGGTNAAIITADMLHHKLLSSDTFSAGNFLGSMQSAFEETDKFIVEKSNEEGWMNGSTAVVGIVVDSELYVGNIGDSEACIVSVNGENAVSTTNLTTPHKASDPAEKERIEKLGGHVFFGRVYGALAVSRSFGDSKYKRPKTSQDFVSWEPAVKQVRITPEHKYIILACDGLWDVIDHDQAAAIVHKCKKNGKSAGEAASDLVQEALAKRTEDNVTVVVVYIEHHGENEIQESEEEDEDEDEDDNDEEGEEDENDATDKENTGTNEKGSSECNQDTNDTEFTESNASNTPIGD